MCVLLVIGLDYFLWSLQVDLRWFTIAQAPRSRGRRSGVSFSVQIVLTLVFVPAIVGRMIAEERERNTLNELLMTSLSSFEVISGKVAAGLLQYLSTVAAVLPITVLLPILGGVDPQLVLVGFAATLSTAYFLACSSILVSIGARSSGQAFRLSFGFGSLWLIVPLVGELVLPQFYRIVYLGSSRSTSGFWRAVRRSSRWEPFAGPGRDGSREQSPG